MQRTLEELEIDSNEISERTITLGCNHSFTVETLDGMYNLPYLISKEY